VVSDTAPISVIDGSEPQHIPTVRQLFVEYADWLEVDLCFQGFAEELAGLPGSYAPPKGGLLLATVGSLPAGCVGVRPFESDVCEMKRLWVRERYRGLGLGKILVNDVLNRAAAAGYGRVRLDTLPKMKSAIGLYEGAGFYPIAPYYPSPLPSTMFLEKKIQGTPICP